MCILMEMSGSVDALLFRRSAMIPRKQVSFSLQSPLSLRESNAGRGPVGIPCGNARYFRGAKGDIQPLNQRGGDAKVEGGKIAKGCRASGYVAHRGDFCITIFFRQRKPRRANVVCDRCVARRGYVLQNKKPATDGVPAPGC